MRSEGRCQAERGELVDMDVVRWLMDRYGSGYRSWHAGERRPRKTCGGAAAILAKMWPNPFSNKVDLKNVITMAGGTLAREAEAPANTQ